MGYDNKAERRLEEFKTHKQSLMKVTITRRGRDYLYRHDHEISVSFYIDADDCFGDRAYESVRNVSSLAADYIGDLEPKRDHFEEGPEGDAEFEEALAYFRGIPTEQGK